MQTIKKFKTLPTKLKLRSDLLAGITGMLLCTFLALYLINGEIFTLNLDLPFIFHGDGLSHQVIATRLSEGWWTNNIRQGFPFGSNHFGYPISENAILLFLKVLLTLGISATTSINLLLLIGFPLTFLAAFFVLQSFKINRALSFVGGMLYSFTTYHVYHFEHFMYASYFIVPIYFWVSFQLIVSEKRSKCLNNRFFVFCLLVALSGFATYYVIFGGILMSFSMFFFVKRERVVIQIKDSLFMLFSTFMGLVVNFSPSIWFYVFHRSDDFSSPIVRSRTDADVFSFRIAQLILPNQDHIIPSIRDAVRTFNTSIPWGIHTHSSSVGLYASLGLIISFFVLFRSVDQSKTSYEQFYLARMSWLLVLVGTIGGLGSILSYIGFEQIRNWQRISIFITFSCIAVSCYVIQFLTRNLSKVLQVSVCALLLLLGVLDQVGGSVPFTKATDTEEFILSKKFLRDIENVMPNASAIYNLPYVEYPETIAPGTMQTYHHSLGLIGSKSLKWSYGTMKGSPGDDFWRSLSNEDITTQVRVVSRLGFAGIYVDLRGYEGGGSQIVTELMEAGGYDQRFRGDRSVVFFRIPILSPLISTNLDVDQIGKTACYENETGTEFLETC